MLTVELSRSDYRTYTRGGITHILAGRSNDVDLILAADGDLPDHSDAGGVHYAKPDTVVSGYDFFADQNRNWLTTSFEKAEDRATAIGDAARQCAPAAAIPCRPPSAPAPR